MAKKQTEKWVMKRGMHLGFIKHTVKMGTVVEHLPEEGKLRIDGLLFESTKDLQILINNKWVEPFSKKAAQVLSQKGSVKEEEREQRIAGMKETPKEMPVVQSDADDHETIDIRHTIKQKPEPRKKDDSMKVIRGDETAEERIARLQSEKTPMPIVQDDSLGSSGVSLNAGQVQTRTAEDHEKLRQEGKEKAEKGFTDKRLKGDKASEAKPRKKAKKTRKKARKKSELSSSKKLKKLPPVSF